MNITRQRGLDAWAADGTAPRQRTITRESNRLRVRTGAVVMPGHRDGKHH